MILSIFMMVFMFMGGSPQPGQQPNTIAMLMPLILIFFIMYFFMIRPQVKKQKAHQAMLQSLKKGDKIITTGGIYGKIVNIKDRSFVIQVSENTRIEITKNAVAAKQEKSNGGASNS